MQKGERNTQQFLSMPGFSLLIMFYHFGRKVGNIRRERYLYIFFFFAEMLEVCLVDFTTKDIIGWGGQAVVTNLQWATCYLL